MPAHELENVLSHRRLSPANHELLQRNVVVQAKALRAEFLHELWRQIAVWYQRRVALTQLHALDDASLKDIGLHRSGIEAAVDHGLAKALPQRPRSPQGTPNGTPQLCLQGIRAA